MKLLQHRSMGVLLAVGVALTFAACRVTVRTSSTGTGRPMPPPPPPKAAPAQGSGHAGIKVAFRWQSRARFVSRFKWSQPVCENVGPPAQPPAFRGVARNQAAVGVRGRIVPAPPVRARKVAKRAQPAVIKNRGKAVPPVAEPAPEIVSGQGDPGPAPQPPEIPQGNAPTVQELAQPAPPPETPPANVFGYEKPARGCFEGQVYFLSPETKRLPTDYARMTASTVLYACEWDIPQTRWEQGFPGIKDRFEWFAIRYAGTFDTATAGSHTFRVSSDDGARLTIDGKVVIDNDGVHPPAIKSGNAELKAGPHEMVLEYFQGPRYLINLQLYVTPPGGAEGLFSVR